MSLESRGGPFTAAATALAPLVLVGANSRAARAIAVALAGRTVIPVHRAGAGGVIVPRYEDVPTGVIPPRALVVNCVGIASGSSEELLRINRDVAVRWAEVARAAGAAHFMQISSFSVYGRVEDMCRTTPERPSTAYGNSKLEADRALLPLAGPSFLVTAVRVPILIGGGGSDKLAQLVRLVMALGAVPATNPPVERSMLSYHGLGAAVSHIASQRAGGIIHAADPALFTYALLHERLAAVASRTALTVPIPRPAGTLAKLVAPSLHSRLLASSRLDPSDNILTELPPTAGIAQVLTDIIRDNLASAR